MTRTVEIVKATGKGRDYILRLFGFGDKLVATMGFKSKAAAERAKKSLLEMSWLVTAG